MAARSSSLAWALGLWSVRLPAALHVFPKSLDAGAGGGGVADDAVHGLPPDALQALDELWGGSDSTLPAAIERLIPGNRSAPPAAGRRDMLPKIQVLGAFDSGTNLLWGLLRLNIGDDVLSASCPLGELANAGSCWFWKHTPPGELDHQVELLREDGSPVVLVAMVRSPLAHISGWIKAPYDLKQCVTGFDANWTDYHDRPCSLDAGGMQDTFAGATGAWNRYTQAYDEHSGGAHKGVVGLVVEYERLVFEPEGVVREVADALGTELSAPFQSIEVPAKTHGEAHGRERAIKEIKEKRYVHREPMSNGLTRARLCEHLDAATMARHVVHAAGSYADDCRRPDS